MLPARRVPFHFAVRSLCSAAPRLNYIGQAPEALQDQFKELGLKETVEKQVWENVYNRGVCSFDQIPDGHIGKNAKSVLQEHFSIDCGTICEEKTSETDGTTKWLIQFGSHRVESLCLSRHLVEHTLY